MGFESNANEQATAFAGSRREELSPLLAWLANPHEYEPDGRAAAPSRAELWIDRACAHIRRHPLQSVAIAAAGGFLAGMVWDALLSGRRA